MAHSLASGMNTAILGDCAPVCFFEVDTPSGNTYFWTGIGQITWNSISWTGLGNILGFSAVTETIEVQAVGLVLSLNGVPTANISLALNSLRRFWPMKAWIGAISSSFTVVADPYQFFNGLVDSCVIVDEGQKATIQAAGESRLTSMKQPKERRFTDQDQRIERSYDGGFKFVDFIQSVDINWGGSAPAPTPVVSADQRRKIGLLM